MHFRKTAGKKQKVVVKPQASTLHSWHEVFKHLPYICSRKWKTYFCDKEHHFNQQSNCNFQNEQQILKWLRN